jgi:hypothetical protein
MQPYVQPIIALIAGILILVRPKLLNYVVAIYLIIVGVMGLARLYRWAGRRTRTTVMGQNPEVGPPEPKAAAPGHFHKLVPRQPGTAVERGPVERAFSTPAWPVLADPAEMLQSVLVGPAVPLCTLHKPLREVDAQH